MTADQMNQAQRAALIIEEEGVAAFFDQTDFTRGCRFVYNHAETGGRRDEIPIEFEDGSRLVLRVFTYEATRDEPPKGEPPLLKIVKGRKGP